MNALWSALLSKDKSFVRESLDDLWPHLNDSEPIHKRLSMELLDECAICHESVSDDRPVDVTECRHHFHSDCLALWTRRHGSCPVCRAHVGKRHDLRTTVRQLKRDAWRWQYDSFDVLGQILEAFNQEPSAPYAELFVDGATRVELLIDFTDTSRRYNSYHKDMYKKEMPASSLIKRDLEVIANEWSMILSRFPERRHQLMVAMNKGSSIAHAYQDYGAAEHYLAQVNRIALHNR